jgi:glycosyltransferase involved in cell wall biosynthesis
MTHVDLQSYPKISIVTPCYNHVRFIDETMRSIHSQGYPRLEHIVIDGGSTDGSLDVLLRYADRLAWWCSERDSGHGEALAKGIQRATGEILTWVCSDDLLLPGALFSVARYFQQHPQEDWVVGDGLKIDGNSRILRLIYGMPLTHSGLVHWTFGGTVQPSIFVRTEAFERAGRRGKFLDLAPDFDLALRLARRRPSGYLRSFLGALRIHSETQTIRKNDQLQRVVATLRQRELQYSGCHRLSWVRGRRALVRYAATRMWRLSTEVVAPSPYCVGEQLGALIPMGTPACEQQGGRADVHCAENA